MRARISLFKFIVGIGNKMSKWTTTKFKFFVLGFVISCLSGVIYSKTESAQHDFFSACMATDSDLPLNHINHPCQASYLSNQSWWSWLKGDSPSANAHFLDLVELIHHTLLKK